jgi:hypothetical protein
MTDERGASCALERDPTTIRTVKVMSETAILFMARSLTGQNTAYVRVAQASRKIKLRPTWWWGQI